MKGEERFMENVERSVFAYSKWHDKIFENKSSTTVCFTLITFFLYRPLSFIVYAYSFLIK